MPDNEWYGLVDVNAQLHRRGMVRQYGNADRLIHLFDSLHDRLDEPLVQIVDGAQLQVQVAVVTSLVGSLDMHENEIVGLQRVDSRLRLSLIVGIGKACSSGNLDDTQTGIATDTLYEVDSRDDGSALDVRKLLHQRLHGRTIAAAPRPDAVGLTLPLSGLCHVVGVFGKQLLRLQDKLIDEVGSLLR